MAMHKKHIKRIIKGTISMKITWYSAKTGNEQRNNHTENVVYICKLINDAMLHNALNME